MIYFVLGALLLAAVLGWAFVRSRDFKVPNPHEADGEIMDIEEISLPGINPIKMLWGTQERTVRYHPVVRFRLDSERLVRFRSRRGYKEEGRYKIGDRVKVLYSKDNPLVAAIKE